MGFNQYETLVHAEQALREQGYVESFVLEEDKMCCVDTGNTYSEADMHIDEYHRFEGETNPADMSIIFAVTCKDGTKGSIVSAYGPKMNFKLIEFLDKVKIQRNEEESEAKSS